MKVSGWSAPGDSDNITAIPANYMSVIRQDEIARQTNCQRRNRSANNSEAQRFTSSASRRIAGAPECASRKIKCQINADDKFAGRTSDARGRTARPANLQRIIWNLIRRHINAWSTTDKTAGEKRPRSPPKAEITKSAAFILRVLNPAATKTARTFRADKFADAPSSVFCSTFSFSIKKEIEYQFQILRRQSCTQPPVVISACSRAAF